MPWQQPDATCVRLLQVELNTLYVIPSHLAAASQGQRKVRHAAICQSFYRPKSSLLRCSRAGWAGGVAMACAFPVACFHPLWWVAVGLAGVCLLGAALGAWLIQRRIKTQAMSRAQQQGDVSDLLARNRLVPKVAPPVNLASLNRHEAHVTPLGGLHQRGFACLSSLVTAHTTASELNQDAPDLLISALLPGAEEKLQPVACALREQILQSTRYLRHPDNGLDVRGAIKVATDLTWMHKHPYFKGQTDEPQVYAVAGVLFRAKQAFVLNIGNHHVLLCHPRGSRRLTVDHGRFDATESSKRAKTQTSMLSSLGLYRGVEVSHHPMARAQRPQITCVPIGQVIGGALIIVNAALAAVVSDAAIDTYVRQNLAEAVDAQIIAEGLTRHAVAAYHATGQNPRLAGHAPAAMVVRPPKPGSINTKARTGIEYRQPKLIC